ncbi:MAG: hypothetical protein PVI43_05825 [Candidatus Bathyarchaeota archaeon]
MVIDANSILTVNQGETATIEGELHVNGTDDAVIELKIVNNGEFTIKGTSVRCNHANLTINNTGTLTLQSAHFTVIGNSTLVINNEENCFMTDASVDVFGGFAYFVNTGSLTVQNGYFKDQFDGTFITNYGEAELSETTFVVNGAKGKIEIFNGGDLQLRHGVFDVNYGGTVNMNSLTGTLTMTECSMDVSGASHGNRSSISILGDKATWESCSFVNNNGLINYLNTGEVSVNNCTIYLSSVNASTVLSSSGPMAFENFGFSGSGSTTITNWDTMTLVDSSFNSSHHLNLMNNGKLTTENWLLKTTSSAARIVFYNGNNATTTFNVPFIEDVSSSVLDSIGSEGQEFVESSGGIITITNNGLMEKQGGEPLGLDYLFYVLIVVAAVAVSIIIILRNRKKER